MPELCQHDFMMKCCPVPHCEHWDGVTDVAAPTKSGDTTFYQCPYNTACKCKMGEPCEGCETWAQAQHLTARTLELELCNGQCWEQREFPNFRIMVLMLPGADGEPMFCKLDMRGDGPPLVMTEESGAWMYTKEQLLSRLRSCNYTPGWAIDMTGVYKEGKV